MKINSNHTNRLGQNLVVEYRDIEDPAELLDKEIQCVHAYCFSNGQLVTVYDPIKGGWTPPGGQVEPGESVEDAVVREVLEESNMHVLRQKLIGYQDIHEPGGTITQTRSVCIVEPMGNFVADPAGDVTAIKLIDPKDYKKYFDWKEIGDHVMARALELHKTLK